MISGKAYKRWAVVVKRWAVVVAQLVERSLPTPEVRVYNPVIWQTFVSDILFVYCQLY